MTAASALALKSRVLQFVASPLFNAEKPYLEGDAWCAYERSAYYLTQMEVPVVLKKEVIHDDYDVVLLKAFFAVNDMYLPLSPTAVLKLVADDKLQFQIRDRVEGFSEWKENELKKLSA
jgi:hypothetical protein